MESRRIPPNAQPEIQFAGSADVRPSEAAGDPSAASAFVGFRRHKTTGATLRRPFLTRGGVALTALAVLGFGGGLLLAFFSFNSPDGGGVSIASRPPEIIYTAPPRVEDAAPAPPSYVASGEIGLIFETQFALRAQDEPIPETSLWRDVDPRGASPFGGSFAAAGGPALAMLGEQPPPAEGPSQFSGGDVTTGYDAITVAAVPEPSTWATLVSGAGLLLAASHLKRRRS